MQAETFTVLKYAYKIQFVRIQHLSLVTNLAGGTEKTDSKKMELDDKMNGIKPSLACQPRLHWIQTFFFTIPPFPIIITTSNFTSSALMHFIGVLDMTNLKNKFILTGTTGNIGSHLLNLFSKHQIPIKALSRHLRPEIKNSLITWINTDWNQTSELTKAFAGSEILFLLTGTTQSLSKIQRNAVFAAKEAGIKTIVKVSAHGASAQSKSPLSQMHWEVEEAIRELFPENFVILRPQIFMQNFLSQAISINNESKIYGPSGPGKIPFIDTRDVAEVAFSILQMPAPHLGRTYILTGPEALSYYEVAAILSEVLERKITYVDQSEDTVRNLLTKKGHPEWFIQNALTLSRGEKGGHEAISDVVKILGRGPRPLIKFVWDHKSVFCGTPFQCLPALKTFWTADQAHTQISFKARYLLISFVTGYFTDFNAMVETEGDRFDTATIKFIAKTASLTTFVQQRDSHLKSEDFFDVDLYAFITFESQRLERTAAENVYAMHGNLTIKKTTLPVVLTANYGGMTTDAFGETKAGFHIMGKVSRKAFGLLWNQVTSAGRVIVADEITIECNVQLKKQSHAPNSNGLEHL